MTRVWTLFFIVIIGVQEGLSVAKQCTSQGKFPNDHENSCVGYTMCLIAGVDHFMEYNLRCPDGFIFNHVLGQCTNDSNSSYQCQPTYNCTRIGNFRNPFKDDCNSYIACIEGFSDVITARTIDCPYNYTFSPDEGVCINENGVKCDFMEQDSYTLVNVTESKIEESTESSACTKSITVFGIYLLFLLSCILANNHFVFL